MVKKEIIQTDIFNYKSKEFYINLNPKDIPPKGSDGRKDFISWEKEKCKKGINVNGVFIPPTLYWHLNHIQIDIDELDEDGNIIAVSNIPELRDNDWIFHNGYYQAYNRKDKKILQVLGSRQLGKSVNESSILLHQAQIFKNSRCLLMGGSSNDIGIITKYINTMHLNMTDFLKVPLLDKDFNKPEVKFGFKKNDNTDIVYSTLFIRNTDAGKATEVSAGVTINVAVIDECGKFEFSEAFAAVKPALVSKFGWRASPIITGTGGSFEKGKDAKKYFFKPEANDVLPFDQEDGKQTGLFISGLYRQDGKIQATFKDLVTSQETLIKSLTKGVYKKTTTELDNMIVWIKDDEKAKLVIKTESDNYLKNNDQVEYLKHKMYYPQDYNDIFLSKSTNPYYSEGLKSHLQFLLSNPIGQSYDLFKMPDGSIKSTFSSKPVIATYPTPPEYLFRDAAIVIYDQPRYNNKQTYKIHVGGCDPYNTDQSKTSDSLGSVYIIRRQNTNISEDAFQDTMVASYTGRPAKLDDFHKNVMYLLELYNATVLNEASNSTFFQYFDNKQKGHYVEEAIQLQREINPNSQASNTKGLSATPKNKQFRQDLIVKYMYDDESFDGKPGYTRILDPILCMELLEYNPDSKKGNYDRIDGFGHALVHLFKEQKYRPIVDIEYEDQLSKPERKIKFDAFGNVRKSSSLSNAFGF